MASQVPLTSTLPEHPENTTTVYANLLFPALGFPSFSHSTTNQTLPCHGPVPFLPGSGANLMLSSEAPLLSLICSVLFAILGAITNHDLPAPPTLGGPTTPGTRDPIIRVQDPRYPVTGSSGPLAE
ncbi:hypothetical protein QCA50_010420 [Cerrena zonata]|uniref:Uncharacterized protein n=1 Tax=Cerrena zonata TaxID=2478898 RepID=A0AAW0GAV1_9APHY